MKKILISVMTLVLVLGLVGAGAFAYFSDTEVSTGNTFTAGTLTLDIANPSGSLPFTFDNMAPGAQQVGSIAVTNIGTIDGWLYGRTTYTNNGTGNPDLGEMLIVTYWSDPTYTNPLISMTLRDFVDQTHDITFDGKGWMAYGQLGSNATESFWMTIQFDPLANNTYQGESVNVTFEFLLHQNDLTI